MGNLSCAAKCFLRLFDLGHFGQLVLLVVLFCLHVFNEVKVEFKLLTIWLNIVTSQLLLSDLSEISLNLVQSLDGLPLLVNDFPTRVQE